MARKSKPKIKPEHDYHRFPQLAAFIDRIGAKQTNFSRFVLFETVHGYSRPLATIKIIDRKIVCDAALMPTDAEAAAIAVELVAADFPTSIHARNLRNLKQHLQPDHIVHTMIDRRKSADEGNIVMVQERINREDGSKDFRPWTFFSDGEWRCMEPDSIKLPFWKPPKKVSDRIMVHEGAKAAEFCHDLTTNPARHKELAVHPWSQALQRYEHWGLIGGAFAAPRADYSELHHENPTEVVYVCDNDHEGREVLAAFSKAYDKPLLGIQFDNNWPAKFDLADPFPNPKPAGEPDLFWKDDGKGHMKWIGHSFDDLTVPATWTTSETPSTKHEGKFVHALHRHVIREWSVTITPKYYTHEKLPWRPYTEKEFNDRCAPFSHIKGVGGLLDKVQSIQCDSRCYDPSRASGRINRDGVFQYNYFTPSRVRPIEGNVDPFLHFMEQLLPVASEREVVMRWCATLVVRPADRMKFGMLLISEKQGVGKTTLGETILAQLVGKHNTSTPHQHEVAESAFNRWIAGKRLAVVNEIYAGHNAKAYDKLKSTITDTTVSVNEKNVPQYELENWLHVFACSNSERALQLPDEDRRWYIPMITEHKQETEYWQNLNRWLETGGLAHVRWYLEDELKSGRLAPIPPGMTAPASETKRRVIEENYSESKLLVLSVLKQMQALAAKDPPQFTCVTDQQLQDHIKAKLFDGRHDRFLDKLGSIRKYARGLGLCFTADRVFISPLKDKGRLISTNAQVVKVIDQSNFPASKELLEADVLLFDPDTGATYQPNKEKPM